MTKRDEIVALARSYIGTPWVHQGRSRTGIDCAGLVRAVGIDAGLIEKVWDFRVYEREPNGMELVEVLKQQGRRKPTLAMKHGDVLVLKHMNSRWPAHMAILAEDRPYRTMIHSFAEDTKMGYGGVVEHRLDQEWERCIRAVFEFNGVEE